MQRIVIFLLGLVLGGGLMGSVPMGQAHDDLTGALVSPENHPLLLHMTTGIPGAVRPGSNLPVRF